MELITVGTDYGAWEQDIEKPFSKRDWCQFLRQEAKYCRANKNQDRLNAFGVLGDGFYISVRRMNARQRRRSRHWDRVADKIADKMDRV